MHVKDVIDDLLKKCNITVILVGPPQSGKSHFGSNLNGIVIQYIRAKVSNFQVRQKFSAELDQNRDSYKNIIIDRQNGRKIDREFFIRASKYYNRDIYCVYFNISKNEKVYENYSLPYHKRSTTHSISRYYNSFEIPSKKEGFDRVFVVNNK